MTSQKGKPYKTFVPGRKSDNYSATSRSQAKPNNAESVNTKKSTNTLFIIILLVAILAIGVKLLMSSETHEEGFIVEKEGTVELAPWRQEKLQRELDEIDNAEQYVLLTIKSGIYPCYNCPNATILLNANNVWKYGVTRKQEKGRYGQNALEKAGLKYFIQFTGTYSACLKEEKRKIYFYATLPENLVREIPLIRPPGNKVDN